MEASLLRQSSTKLVDGSRSKHYSKLGVCLSLFTRLVGFRFGNGLGQWVQFHDITNKDNTTLVTALLELSALIAISAS